MSISINKIARLLTEDPDVFTNYQEKFSSHTVLDEEIYGNIVGILKDVAEKNGLKLDHRRLKVKFNPAGISIQNIHLDCSDPGVKRKLIDRVAEVTGDDNIKNTFNKNLRVNLYSAINKEFADRVREELNLEVTHQSIDSMNAKNPSEVMPMATFAQPAVTAEKPEEEMEMEPTGSEPEGGPEGEPAPEGDPGMGMGGMGGGMGGMGGLGDIGELPSGEEDLEGLEDAEGAGGAEEPAVGPYGVEPPAEGEEEEEAGIEKAPPPEPDEEKDMLSFESINRIANMLTEDPDIFTESRCPGKGCKGCSGEVLPCWVCGKRTDKHPYVDGEKPYGYCGCEG